MTLMPQSSRQTSTHTFERTLENKKQQALVHFTSLHLRFRQEFQVELFLSGNKLSLKGQQHLPSAISLLNYILSLDIVEEEIKSRLPGWSEFQYFKSLNNSRVIQLSLKHKTLVIPFFFFKDSHESMAAKNCMLVVGNRTQVEPFLQEYRKIDWTYAEEIPLVPSIVYYNHHQVKDLEKYTALKLLRRGEWGLDEVIIKGRVLCLVQADFERYTAMERDYVLESTQGSTSRWLTIINVYTPPQSQLIHEIQMLSEINKIVRWEGVRKDLVFYIRHKSQPSFQEILEKNNIKQESGPIQRFLILERKGVSEPMKDCFYSRLTKDKIKRIKVQMSVDSQFLVIRYKSSSNLNQSIREVFDQVRTMAQLRHKYEITQDIKACLDRFYYKSTLNKLANELSFEWSCKREDNAWHLEIFECLSEMPLVESRVGEELRKMKLCRYIFTLLNNQGVRSVEASQLDKSLNKLKEQVVTVKPENKLILEGVFIRREDMEETKDDLRLYMDEMNIPPIAVRMECPNFSDFRMEEIVMPELFDQFSLIADRPEGLDVSINSSMIMADILSVTSRMEM